MGGCFSDKRGGQQAIGGVPRPTGFDEGGAAGTGTDHNDAVDYFMQSRGFHELYTQLELSLSASKLRDRDILSKSDPMAVMYAKKKDGTLEELGRTEVILNSLDPSWISKLTIAYQFETVQPLVFQVYDVDSKFHNIPVKMLKLNEQDFLGETSCVLSEIVTKKNKSLTLPLHWTNAQKGMKNIGTLTIHAEETIASRTVVEMILRGVDLENKELFSKSDPFLRISRFSESGDLVPICKTEVVDNNLNPTWKPLVLTMQQFGSKDNPLVIECYDFNSNGRHAIMGKLQKSLEDLEALNKEKTGAHFYSHSTQGHKKMLKGQLFVDKFCESVQYSFLDYIASGFELNFMVAIDFTASNGNPRLPESLHYIDPSGRLNAYQQAILEVGEVIQFYDSDKRFSAWGFGGRPIGGSVSHCFNLNGRTTEPELLLELLMLPNSNSLGWPEALGFNLESADASQQKLDLGGQEAWVEGVQGILAAYSSALHNNSLAGPTLFGKVINVAAEIAGHALFYNQPKYFVLLIITDGVVTDLQETKDAIVKASDLPLSILIIGVGGADFKDMEVLDADNGQRLEGSTGRIATRDIVQFVPMRDVHGGQISIVQSLLEELPGQFLAFMKSRDIKPRNVTDPQTS